MEPLSGESGNDTAAGDLRQSRAGFNGAALRRERKRLLTLAKLRPKQRASMEPLSGESGNTVVRVKACLIQEGFNGAALRRERKPLCSMLTFTCATRLQWSRSPERAETVPVETMMVDAPEASMEPLSGESGNDAE